MKHLSELLNTEFWNSLSAKRAQVRNEILDQKLILTPPVTAFES